MPQLVEHHAAHIQAHRQLPMANRRLEWPIIGVPAQLCVQDRCGARDRQAPVGAVKLLLGTRGEIPEMLIRARPTDHVGRHRLLDQERHNRRPLREGIGRVVIPTGRTMQERPACVAQLQADGNRRGGPHQRCPRALVLDDDGASEHVVGEGVTGERRERRAEQAEAAGDGPCRIDGERRRC